MAAKPKSILPSESERPRIQSVARAFAILLEVAGSPDGLTAKELSDRLGLSRQTVYHLLHTLRATGFLTKSGSNGHQLGLAVGTLSEAFNRQMAPPAHLTLLARKVATSTGEATYIAGWLRGEVVVLSNFPGQHAVRVGDLRIGTVGDAHARASGKALLAFLPKEVRDDYLERHPRSRRTPNTIVDKKKLDEEFARVRQRGYALDEEEFAEGICCISVALDRGASPFVLSIAAPKERFLKNRNDYVKAMLDASEEASWSVDIGASRAPAAS